MSTVWVPTFLLSYEGVFALRAPVRSGRCWVPPEWRPQLGVKFWRQSAYLAVTGAPDRRTSIEVLSAHLPLIPGSAEPAGQPEPQAAHAGGPAQMDAHRAEIIVSSPDAAGAWPHACPPVDSDDGGFEDADSARRMARRLSRLRRAPGTRELLTAGFVPVHLRGVYAWRAARHGEHVYRVSPDGTFTPVAVYREVRAQDHDGQWRTRLVAGRPW